MAAALRCETYVACAQTDIWALGLITYYLLTGRVYWRAASNPEAGITTLFGEVLLQAGIVDAERARIGAHEIGRLAAVDGESRVTQRRRQDVALALQRCGRLCHPVHLGVQGVRDRRLERPAADVGHELLRCARRRHQGRRARHPTDLPAGAVERLRRAGDTQGSLAHTGQRRDRPVRAAVEQQVLVDLVGDGDDVVFLAQRGDRGQVVVGEHRAGRVVRRIDDDGGRLGAERLRKAVAVDAEAVPVGDHRHGAPPRAGHGDRRRIGVVVRLDEHDLVAGLDEADDGAGDRLGGADGDQDLGVGVVVQPVVIGLVVADGATQLGDAEAGRVLVAPIGDRLLRGSQHGGGPVRVGEALAEVDRIVAGGERGHLGKDGLAEGAEALHGHRTTVTHRCLRSPLAEPICVCAFVCHKLIRLPTENTGPLRLAA